MQIISPLFLDQITESFVYLEGHLGAVFAMYINSQLSVQFRRQRSKHGSRIRDYIGQYLMWAVSMRDSCGTFCGINVCIITSDNRLA